MRNLDELNAAIALQIAAIDRQLVSIVRQVLHHPKFQQLESSYRSIYALVANSSSHDAIFRNVPAFRRVNVFVLDISAEELQLDLGANSYRQTWIYDKLFRKRFDLLIGEQNINIENYSAVYPFSLIVVDFDFGLTDFAQKTEFEKATQVDLSALRKLAKVGEECFCMFLLSLAPQFFGESIKSFSHLENVIDVKAILRQSKYKAWNHFREQEEARMIGITLPRVLVREPYRNLRLGRSVDAKGNVSPATGIVFDEHDGFGKNSDLLWGRSSFAVIQPMIRSFKRYDWFSDVCGVDRDVKKLATSDDETDPAYDGGMIDKLPYLYFRTDARSVASYSPAEIVISEADEASFSSIGFIPVFSINQSSYVATLSSQTVQTSREMSTIEASNNLRLSSMFNYMLCVCRMAHRLKIECRSQIGKSVGPEAIQDHMQRWLMEHSSGRNRGLEQKMIKPFLDEHTGFFVYEDITDPGRYDCTIRLCPHHKYDNGQTRLIFEPVSLQMQINSEEAGQ
jgi:type VI secretion system protein ImpD